jgi:hypothetical protein
LGASALGGAPSRRLRLEEPEAQKRKPRARQTRQDETTLYLTSTRYRECCPEPSCSSRARRASPSVRIDSSSCGSRHVLQPSSARREPYMPSLAPHRTLAEAESLRIGVETSLVRKNTLCPVRRQQEQPHTSSQCVCSGWATEPFQPDTLQIQVASYRSIAYKQPPRLL